MSPKRGKHAFAEESLDGGHTPNGGRATGGVIDPESSRSKFFEPSTQPFSS